MRSMKGREEKWTKAEFRLMPFLGKRRNVHREIEKEQSVR